MPRWNVGDRVAALSHTRDGKVYLFGYGVYVGEEIPPSGIQCLGIDLHSIKRANPKILLDNGKVVWGCECWWGSEEVMKSRIVNKEVEFLDIDFERWRHANGSKFS
jgi:hypothetical protein